MSTSVRDFPTAVSVAAGHDPQERTSSINGTTVELGGDGPCFAVQQVGPVSGDNAALVGRIEQSTDGTSWSVITDATFTAVITANNLQVIRFDPTARYVRWAADITGDTPTFVVAVLLGQQKKTF